MFMITERTIVTRNLRTEWFSVKLHWNVFPPDYRADYYRGNDEGPVDGVLVGEDAHPKEEEDDAVAEKL